MADFAGYDQEWSLQAIVKGCANGYTNLNMMDSHQQTCSFSTWGMPQSDHDHHQDLLFAFSDHLLLDQKSNNGFDDELEAFYKPFYPVSDISKASKEAKDEVEHIGEKQRTDEEVQEKQPICLDQSTTTSATAYVPKYKRRKNQHKRVAIQVTAEGLSSDKWSWRKYGQKPIKGSPYPRSYYRCSSMKGCLARKQVEQSCTDPSMFIVTYTAEHCHSQPTRRNSLAGTIRNKLRANLEKIKDSSTSSPSSSEAISPKSISLMASTEEELSETKVEQENIDEDEEGTVQWACGNEFSISDILMDDDFFFAGLENLDGSISEFNPRP